MSLAKRLSCILGFLILVFTGCATSSAPSTATDQSAVPIGDASAVPETAAEDEPTFRVTEDYWVETPWFGVSSIVLKVGRTSPETTIVLPESSVMRDYMRDEAGVVIGDSFEGRSDQFLLSLGFQLDDKPAFIEEARIRQSFIYE